MMATGALGAITRITAMTEAFDQLREQVKDWYRQEALRLGEAVEGGAAVEALDFDELVRRSQVLFACEMFELAKGEEDRRLEPGSPDHIQLMRVAQAMRDSGTEVPESIARALGEDRVLDEDRALGEE
jgi:hypothetical protein